MDEVITVLFNDGEPASLPQVLSCRMEIRPGDNFDQFGFHIQNYSLKAAKAFISEVKKYPIIYVGTRNSILESANLLTKLAWSRIVVTLMGDGMEFNLQRRHYWEKSFRELWNWMRSVLKKDMRDRARDIIKIRSVAHSWLSHMRFLEPYVCLRGTPSDIDTEINPDICIHIKSFASQLHTDASCIYWLNHPTESIESEDMYISLCFRNPIDLTSYDLKDPVHLTKSLPIQSNTPSSPTSSLSLPFDEMQFGGSIEQINALPPLNAGQISVDEDYDYIMSFLPLLKQLEPKRNAEVKVMLMKALSEEL